MRDRPSGKAWIFRNTGIDLSRGTALMGILNVTPDSFSDGGLFLDVEAGVSRALEMVRDGADIIDIGGESTRPGAPPVSPEEQCRRILPVIRSIRARISEIPISVDTTHPLVASEALRAGADIVNDISGLGGGKEMDRAIVKFEAGAVIMHMRGTPATMQQETDYADLLGEIEAFLAERAERLVSAGAKPERIALDPGIGFAKTPEQNLTILNSLPRLARLGYPILVGPSRKSFIGKILDAPVERREWGTAAAVAFSIARGASVIRVHNVRDMKEVAKVSDAISRSG